MLLTCMKINTIVAIKMNDIAIGKFSRITSKTSKLYAAKPATFNTPFSPIFSSSINSPRSARHRKQNYDYPHLLSAHLEKTPHM